jgi:DNA-binding PadR family transcriptional regulator
MAGMTPRKLRSPLSLVILGLLAEESLHPYAIRQRIAERGHDRLPGVRFASVYDTVQRMAGAGLISAGDPSREGRRPERVRYAITATGQESLLAWVAEALANTTRGEEFPAALSFMYGLGRDRATEILQARAATLAASLAADEGALAQAEKDGVPSIFLSEHRYQLALRRAECDWLNTFTRALSTGDLAWPKARKGTGS